MVSFQCDGCADTVKKPKLDQHRNRCYASFTCLDCSTTFHDQSYRSHTTCISEAQKYEGALYRGPKKGKGPQPTPSTQITTPADQPQPAPAAPTSEAPAVAAPAIHPSRIAALAEPTSTFDSSRGGFARGRGRGGASYGAGIGGPGGRGGFSARGGRGGFGGPGGGAPGAPPVRYSATGENRHGPAGGMRSWGTNTPLEGSPVPTVTTVNESVSVPAHASVPAPVRATASAPAVPSTEDKKKIKKRKGDKGGTGSKANSKNPPRADGTDGADGDGQVDKSAVEPENKKRKRSASPKPAPAPTPATAIDKTSTVSAATPIAPAPASTSSTSTIPEKTLKRLRKNLSKLPVPVADSDAATPIPLAEALEQLGKGGKKDPTPIDAGDVLRGLRVVKEGDKWVLSV